jgi:L-aspartate oxidase
VNIKADVVIIGTGVAGLYCALKLPDDKKIRLITKSSLKMSDSYLAQGGICVLKEEEDYDSFFLDTLQAGHFENNEASVHQMIRKSPEVIHDLISLGVRFEEKNGKLLYTKEGAHSTARILYHKDITGQEITQKLLQQVKKKKNVVIMEYTEMIDLNCYNNRCSGVILRTKEGIIKRLDADYTVLATGGIGGLYQDSTNYPHLTGDSLSLAIRHKINLKNLNYIQIHPTTLFSLKQGRRFLISESVRGEGAYLLNAHKERFVDELLPRDVLTQKICQQMKNEDSRYVWLSVIHLGSDWIKNRFPNIYHRCLEEGFDITRECIPVTPAQHYFMGGIDVDLHSKTSMEHLYAVGETSCNGVHGANRLASNSLLESLVFAREAAAHIASTFKRNYSFKTITDYSDYDNYEILKIKNKELILKEIERINRNEQRNNIKIKCG